MFERVFLVIDPFQGGALTVSGTHAAFEFSSEFREIQLRVRIDERVVDGPMIQSSGAFSLTFDLPEVGQRFQPLEIQASTGFSPETLGLTGGSQPVALRIREISLRGERLIDFTGDSGASHFSAAPISQRPAGLNVVGYFQHEIGVAQSARLFAQSCANSGIPNRLVDFSEDRANAAMSVTALSEEIENPYAINVFHVNADRIQAAWRYYGRKFFDGRYNIGVWHWELPVFPDEWLECFDYVDELWVPSLFIRDAIGAKSSIPVMHMPHAISFERPVSVMRSEFGLPEESFLFLVMYDMGSFQSRKNPAAALESFKIASDALPQRRLGLVIKVMNADVDSHDFSQLRAWSRENENVTLISETLSRQALYRLEATCDVFVSLHRSEGWGLCLAESMYLEKPVIATGWSGNMDFMSSDNSALVDYELIDIACDDGPYKEGQLWADPKVSQAADWMIRLVEDRALYRELGLRGRQTMESEYSMEAIGRRYQSRFRDLSRMIRDRDPNPQGA